MDPETTQKLRALAHDLSNTIETVTQASYLLAQADLDDASRKWVSMIANAARESAQINGRLREILRAQAVTPAPATAPARKSKPVSKSRSNSGRSRKSGI